MRPAALAVAGILFWAPAAVAQDAAARNDTANPGIASERGLDGFVTVDRLPVPGLPALARGREIWGDTCFRCHGGNKATGAPKITATRAWTPRIEQGMAVLVDHALNGFTGPKYTEMPPRGGNPDLGDDDIRSAVAFMVWASGGSDTAWTWAEETLTKDN